jgi:hypothetical protein
MPCNISNLLLIIGHYVLYSLQYIIILHVFMSGIHLLDTF